MPLNAFAPDGTYASLTPQSGVGADTAVLQLPAGAGTAWLVTNMGPAQVIVVFGASAAACQIAAAIAANGITINASQSIAIAKGSNTWMGACAIGGMPVAILNVASGT